MSNSSYKNVVSVQTGAGHTGAYGVSGLTLAATVSVGAAAITKHKGFILNPTGAAMSVFPTYYGPDGTGLAGITLTPTAAGSILEIPLRMKSFTGLTGGTILFVA